MLWVQSMYSYRITMLRAWDGAQEQSHCKDHQMGQVDFPLHGLSQPLPMRKVNLVCTLNEIQ